MGASSGFGKVTALRFAKRGAKIVVARSKHKLASLVNASERNSGTATASLADVADFSHVQELARRLT